MFTQFHIQTEILSEFYFHFVDEQLGNDELMTWYHKHFSAVSLALVSNSFIKPDGITSTGYLAIDSAMSDLMDILGFTEPTDREVGDRGFRHWGEFLDKVDEVNNGRFQRHDEV